MALIDRFAGMCDAATDLLKRIDDPLHVAIVQNYRRHCWLEIGQRWEEVLSPEMMVENPVYHLSAPGMNRKIEGLEAVRDLYRTLHFRSYPEHEVVAVHDWGIASEAYLHQFVSGAGLDSMGIKHDGGNDDWFDLQFEYAMVWHYNDKGIFTGEHIYAQAWSTKVDPLPADAPTVEDIAQVLGALLDDTEQEWRASLLL